MESRRWFRAQCQFVSPSPPLALFLFLVLWALGSHSHFLQCPINSVCVCLVYWLHCSALFLAEKISVRHKFFPSSAIRVYLDFHWLYAVNRHQMPFHMRASMFVCRGISISSVSNIFLTSKIDPNTEWHIVRSFKCQSHFTVHCFCLCLDFQ